MKSKFKIAHMLSAFNYGRLSTCKKRQVGCVIVKDDSIISYGYNGTPPGWDNCCEDHTGKTKPKVIHAEINAVAKVAKSTSSSAGSSVFVTYRPCLPCSVVLAASGIKDLYYAENHRQSEEDPSKNAGIDYLKKCGISVYHLPLT